MNYSNYFKQYPDNKGEFDGYDGAYLKREDLNHTGSHKLNHCMGEVDIAKEAPNVSRMKLLGAKVVPVSHG